MRWLLLIPFLIAVAVAPSAFAQTVETPDGALAQDAAEYAKAFDVPADEALRRLTAQAESVAVTDRLAERHRARLAGIAIEHRPVWRIVVHLTGDTPVRPEHVVLGGMVVPIAFETGARATRERVIWAMTYHQQQLRAALRGPPAMGLDPRTGELVVVLSNSSEKRDALEARLSRIAGVPVAVRLVERTDVNLADKADKSDRADKGDRADTPAAPAPVEPAVPVIEAGGARLEGLNPEDNRRYLCTTGFTITDGSRYGIATAAHCLDNLSYIGPKKASVPLDYAGQWGWGYRDVQINLASGTLPPLFFSDTDKKVLRPVTAERTRQGTRAGDFVCHRGERSGYSCALVELTDFAPAGDLCGGACLPTWVTVAGPKCKGGDSGGPVFIGSTAMGILKGASYRRDGGCAFYFYMSVDYLPAGWSLVTAPPEGWTPPPEPVVEPQVATPDGAGSRSTAG